MPAQTMTALAAVSWSRTARRTVYPGDPDVVKAGDPGGEEFGGDRGLFRSWEVTGTGADDSDVALFLRPGCGLESDAAGGRVVRGCRGEGLDGGEVVLCGSGGEDGDAAGSHACKDIGGLGWGLAGGRR